MGKLRSDSQRSLQAERQRAVDKAWAAEVELVREGKGTRQWTAAEQKELLSTGKVEGYYGHHMQSVKNYPENAGNKDNIQFLSYDEHINGAHKRNTRNSTNGYYDPQTGQMHEFKDGKLLPITPIDQNDKAFDSAEDRENAYRQGLVDRFNADKNQKLANYDKNLAQRDDLSDQEKADRYKAMSEKYENDKQDYVNRILENDKTEVSDNKETGNLENQEDSKDNLEVDNTSTQSDNLKVETFLNDTTTTETNASIEKSITDSGNGTSDSSKNVSNGSTDTLTEITYNSSSDSSSSSSSSNDSGGSSSSNGGGMDY